MNTQTHHSLKHFLLLAIVLVGFVASSMGQTTIWAEDFSGLTDGTTTGQGDPAITTWTADGLSANADIRGVDVRSEQICGDRTGGAGGRRYWTTDAINIEDYADVEVSIELSSGGNLEGTDYIQTQYSTDGTTWQDFTTNGYVANDITGTISATISGIKATNIYLKTGMFNNNNEFHYIDNILVTGYYVTEEYSTSFEDCGSDWTNSNDDDFDWTCNSGTTPSGVTGPDEASDGTYYLFTEASNPNFPSKEAYIERTFDFSSLSNPVIYFDYHMYGANMGNLYIDIYDGSTWDQGVGYVIGEVQGDNDDPWETKTVDLSAYAGEANVTLRFRGITGDDADDGWQSDIAIDNFILLEYSSTSPVASNSYYSYQTGNWSDANSWTVDASGTTWVNPDNEFPDSDNNATILNGKTITTTANTAAKNLTIEYGGTLDLSTFTHSYTTVSGDGYMKINSLNLPSGTLNSFVNSENGTIEFYDVTGDLPDQTTYNNLILSNSATSTNNLIFQNASDLTYTINGNLSINNTGTGELKTTLGTGADNEITFDIWGDLTVGTDCYFLIGERDNLIHNINIYGNLTDNGVFNINNFNDYTNTTQGTGNNPGTTADEGAAILTFLGESNNTVLVNSNTRFYAFRVNKGSDQTYILSVTASEANCDPFKGYDQFTCIYNKTGYGTISTINGTTELKENLEIARLTPDDDDLFFASSVGDGNGCLWINGANVQNYGSHIAIYGQLKVSAGSLDVSSTNKGAILSRANGQLTITGGTLTVVNYRTSAVLATSPKGGFTMTGGTLELPDDQNTNDGSSNQAKFSIPYTTQAFKMTGGEINIRGISYNGDATNGGLLINCTDYEVTGGTLNIYTPTRDDITINSNTPFYNVNIYNQTGGTNEVQLADQPWDGGSNTDQTTPARPLVVLNKLYIDGTNSPEFKANDENISVGGDFIISNNATYTPGDNTTILNGSSGQEFQIAGTITSGLNNLTLTNTTATVLTPAAGTSLDINGTLTISELCSFEDNGNTITASGTIYNAGTHESNNGVLILDGTATQQIQGNGSGIFGNLELDNTNGAKFYANQVVTDVLTLTNGVLDIDTYELKIYNSNNGAVAGTFGSSNMIKTAGNQSDGGIFKIFGDAPNNTFTYPIGTDNLYTPATITVDATTQGNIIIKPTNNVHPLADDATSNTLQYYWSMESEYFAGLTTVTSSFTYDDANVEVDDADYFAAVYTPYQWTTNDASPTYVDYASNTIHFETSEIDGAYTGGQSTAFPATLTVFYSLVDNGNWDTPTTWSNKEDRSDISSTAPTSGDPVVIGSSDGTFNHTLLIGANNANAGSLEINNGSTLDIGSYTGHNFGTLPNQEIGGTGTLRISSSTATAEFPAGDFGAFIGTSGGTVKYYTNGTNFTLPISSATPTSLSLATYNNLNLMASGTKVITLPNIDLQVFNDLTVGDLSYTNIVRLNSSAEKTLTINNDLNLNTGTLQFNNNKAQNISIDNDLFIANGATFEVRSANTTVENLLNISGNLTNNGTLDLYNDPRYCNLTFSGNTDNSFSGTGSGGTTLYMLTIDKGTSQSAILTMDVAGTLNTLTNDWLTLNNGTFRFASENGDITLTDENDETFTIPSTACLSVDESTASITIGDINDDDCDLLLYGKLEAKTGTINIGNSSNTGANNDIEYTAAGSPEISIEDGGMLNVNGQIRYSLSSTSGALIYNQSGGNVNIYGYDHEDSRAKLAVHNTGSIFNMSGGTITIKEGDGDTYSDIYLRPESSTVTGGTILFDATNDSYKIDANVAIYNLSLTGSTSNSTEINVSTLEILGDLSIDANSVLVANSLDVSIGGNFTLNGTYTPGKNTTLFNGSNTQTITCNNAVSFYDLTLNSTGSINLDGTDNPIVSNDFDLLSGTFDTQNNNIYIRGNATISSTHASTGSGIMYLDGSSPQTISGNGSGQLAKVTLDNGDDFLLETDITISDQLDFTTGMLYIDEYLLSFTKTAPIPTGYDETKFIATNGVSSDEGVRKNLNTGDTDFTFPIGSVGSSSNKYTPAVYDIDGVTGTSPYIQLRPINAKHLATTDTDDKELSYYWNLSTSTGLSVSALSHSYTYLDEDIQDGDESLFVAGRLPYSKTDWIKDGTISTGTNTITFTNTTELHGDYTAGEVSELVTSYIYRTIANNNWTNPNTWEKDEDGDGTYEVSPSDDYPQGNKTIIQDVHIVTSTDDACYSNHLELYGTLDLGNTVQHNFISIIGDGLLKMDATPAGAFIFPGGNNTTFMNTTGSTIEYYSNSGTTELPTIDTYQNLNLTGVGDKTLANADLLIQGGLTIDAGEFDNSTYNNDIVIYGNWTNNTTATPHLSGTSTVTFNGTSAQNINGTSSSESFYNVVINNSNGLVLSQDINLNNDLTINASSSLDGGSNAIGIKGNWTNNSSTNFIANTSTVNFNGTGTQSYTGAAGETFYNLFIGNTNGLTANCNTLITNNIDFVNNDGRKYIIGSNELQLTATSNTIISNAGTSFIETNGLASDGGIIKSVTGSYDFTYPIGSDSKYTSVQLNETGAGGTGTIKVVPVNSSHPFSNNNITYELKYYWIVEASAGITPANITHTYTYDADDAQPNSDNFISGRFYSNSWYKSEGTVASPFITFSAVDFINGEFTAGIESNFDDIETYYSRNNAPLITSTGADWRTTTTWSVKGHNDNVYIPNTIPNTNSVIIASGHNVISYDDGIDIADLTLEGSLDLQTTASHDFGSVSGEGTLIIENNASNNFVLPTANLNDFTQETTGGTIEFNGVGDLPSNSTYNNLTLSGTGTKNMTTTDLAINGDMQITNGVLNNGNDQNIAIKGDWIVDASNGQFNAGDATVTFNGNSNQEITTNSNAKFYNLEINNTNGITLQSATEISNNLLLTDGLINTTESNILLLSNTTSSIVTGASNSSHINGPLNKTLSASGEFSFPVGNAGVYNPITIEDAEADIWQAQYYQGAYNSGDYSDPIVEVSSSEYWRAQSSTGSKNANITLPYSSSGITVKWALVEYDGSEWSNSFGSTANTANQTATTDSERSFNLTGTGNYFTIAESNLIKWIGTTSTDWFTISNWSSGTVPTIIDNVDIPDVSPDDFPEITGQDGNCKDLILETSASLTINNNNLNVAGDFTNNGTFTHTSGSVTFTGAIEQSIAGSSDITFNDVIINKSADSVIVSNPVSVNSSLTFTDGIMVTDATNILTMNDGTTTSGASSDSYIDGPIVKLGDDAFTFPIGTNNQLATLGILDLENFDASTEFTCQYFNEAHSIQTDFASTIDHISTTEYWDLERSSDPGNDASCNIELYYDNADSSGIKDLDLTIAHYNSITPEWEDMGGNVTGGLTSASGTVTSTIKLSSFSPVTFATALSTTDNPLPIELIEFTATVQTNSIELNWATATELNNDLFTIERSSDGIHFEELLTTNGAGNSSSRIDYSETDYNPIYGTSYYRLKQTDYNGKYAYSDVVSVFWNAESGISSGELKVFPNPYTDGDLILSTENIESGKNINLSIYDFNGKMIYNVHLVNPNNQQINIIPMAINNLPQGMYIISIISDSNMSRTKLIIE